MWKTLWCKKDASTRVPHTLAQQEGKKPCVRCPLFLSCLNIAGIFWSCFLRDVACISQEDFLSNGEMCFGSVVLAIDAVLGSLNGKILRINKSWVQYFPW